MIREYTKQVMHNSIVHHPLTDAQPARRLEGHKNLGGDTARTADPNWPQRYYMPCDVMLNNKMGDLAGLGGPLLRGWLGIGQRVVNN